MARLALPAILVIVSMLFAGCASESARHAAIDLPAPNFNAPPLAVPPPQPRVTAPPAVAINPAVRSNRASNVPRDWTPTARANSWRWIVIHHSATPSGSVLAFDRMHKQKGWDECGYHFVIGNGNGAGDGAVEVGPRWPKQKWGAHAKTPDNRFNEYGIGICLVGNCDINRPTARQQAELARLVAHLMKTYNIPPGNVIGHRDTKATECPGRYVNVASIRQQATRVLADAGDAIPGEEQASVDVVRLGN